MTAPAIAQALEKGAKADALAKAIAVALEAATRRRVVGRRPDEDGWRQAQENAAEEIEAFLLAAAGSLERTGKTLLDAMLATMFHDLAEIVEKALRKDSDYG